MAATRFYRSERAAIWDRSVADLQQQANAEGNLDWSLHQATGTVIRARQRAAGGTKKDAST